MSDAASFSREQWGRAVLRGIIVGEGLLCGVFWTAVFIGWTLAAAAGYGFLGWYAVTAYVIVLAPILILQAVLVADLLSYVVVGKIFAFPAIELLAQEIAASRPDLLKATTWSKVLVVLAHTSPLASLALWGLVVLARMPKDTHAVVTIRRELLQRQQRLERAIYVSATERLRIA